MNINENKGKELPKQNKNLISSKNANATVQNSLNKNANNNNYMKKNSGKASNYFTNAPKNNISKVLNIENLIGKKSNINIGKNNYNNIKKSNPSTTSTNKVSFKTNNLNITSKTKPNDNAIHTNKNIEPTKINIL
jgi:hypothetical protein